MDKKLLIFDLDGTLVDSREDLVSAINYMRKKFELEELSFDKIVSFIGHGVTNLVKRSIEDYKEINFETAIQVTKKYYSENLVVKTCLYEGVIEGIKKLYNAGFKLAVLSNKPMGMTKEVIKHFQLENYFEFIIGASEQFQIKPSSEAVDYMITSLDIDRKNIWMIGDHNTDLEVARNANINACFANYGFGSQGKEKFNLKIDSFGEFIKYIME